MEHLFGDIDGLGFPGRPGLGFALVGVHQDLLLAHEVERLRRGSGALVGAEGWQLRAADGVAFDAVKQAVATMHGQRAAAQTHTRAANAHC